MSTTNYKEWRNKFNDLDIFEGNMIHGICGFKKGAGSIGVVKGFIEDLLHARDEEVKQQIEWTIPIFADLELYIEMVETGDMDKIYDYGFNQAKKAILALLSDKETKR